MSGSLILQGVCVRRCNRLDLRCIPVRPPSVKTSVESLKTSVADAGTPVEKATALTGGIAAVEAAWQALTDASDADC